MTKMSKRVIVSKKRAGIGETLEEAAGSFGVSMSTISRSIRGGGSEFRYVDRVYAIRLRSGAWVVAVLDAGNRMYIPVDQDLRKISKREVVEVRDITPVWYFHSEKWPSGTVFDGEDR